MKALDVKFSEASGVIKTIRKPEAVSLLGFSDGRKRSDFLWGCAGAQLPCLWRRDPENRPNEVIPSCHLPSGRSCRAVLKMFQAYCLLLSDNLHNPRE